jgi:hypothetical protein
MKQVIDNLNPPGRDKTNRGRLFSLIERLGEILGQDATATLRNFFPFLSDAKALAAHGKALAVPRYSNDTDESYRQRVAAASFYLQRRGERVFFQTAIGQRFTGREYEIVEEFLHLTVKVLDMMNADRAWLWEFLGKELDPNIAITLVDWFRFVEHIPMAEDLAVNLNDNVLDWLPGDLCHDGQIRHDHGMQLLHAGSVVADGATLYIGVKAKLGTWTGIRKLPFAQSGVMAYGGFVSHAGYLVFASQKKAEGARYANSMADAIGDLLLQHNVSDQIKLAALHVGGVNYGGQLFYAPENSSLLDELSVQVNQL